MRKHTIITKNKELYEKFNLLNLSSEVVLNNTKNVKLNQILKKINRDGDVLSCERIDDYIIIKKLNPVNFSMYLSNGGSKKWADVEKRKRRKSNDLI